MFNETNKKNKEINLNIYCLWRKTDEETSPLHINWSPNCNLLPIEVHSSSWNHTNLSRWVMYSVVWLISSFGTLALPDVLNTLENYFKITLFLVKPVNFTNAFYSFFWRFCFKIRSKSLKNSFLMLYIKKADLDLTFTVKNCIYWNLIRF